MLNLNDFDEGFNDGLRQARKGQKKNFSNFNKLKTFLSKTALDSYIDGVNQGYLDGLREKHLTHLPDSFFSTKQKHQVQKKSNDKDHKSNHLVPNKGDAMNPIIKNQIITLNNLKAFLKKFNESMQITAEQYQRFLDGLADQQMDAQIYQQYQTEFLDETKKRIYDIINNIEESDIKYIERLISHLEETPI